MNWVFIFGKSRRPLLKSAKNESAASTPGKKSLKRQKNAKQLYSCDGGTRSYKKAIPRKMSTDIARFERAICGAGSFSSAITPSRDFVAKVEGF